MDLTQVGVTWIISVSVTVLLLTYLWLSRRNPKYPPCPLRPWPILGNLLQLNPDPREQLARFRKQYGDIFSLYMGTKHVVILSGFDVIKEAFVKQGDNFSDRAIIYVDIATHAVRKGIISSNGALWKEHRTFSTAVLRNLGSGKNILALKIQEEVNHFLELLESFKGEPNDIRYCTSMSVSNIICSIIVGKRYEYDDKEFLRIHELIFFILSKITVTAVFNVFPWIRFLPGDLFSCKIVESSFREFFDIFAHDHIKENEAVIGEPGNFITAYLQEMNRKNESGEKTFLDKHNLLKSIWDLFIAGTETTSTTLEWFFTYMVNYPKVQEHIFKEINEVIGLDRTPGIQDKAKLTYLTATIMEVQRLSSLLTLGVPRLLLRDVNFRGYLIPEGTEIMANFDSVLHDTSLWGDDADKFRPERFIAEDGSLLLPETWIPFSLGRRVCLGEGIAKMELFLFVINILQRYQILPADPNNLPSLYGCFGATHTTLPNKFRFVNRSATY